jgi:hypothetical protein
MLRLFIYREITGDSYRTLETYQELADHVPSPGTGMQPALVGRIQSRQGRAGGPALPTRSSSTVKPTRVAQGVGCLARPGRYRRLNDVGGRSVSAVDLPRLLVGLDSWSASLVSRCADSDNPTTPRRILRLASRASTENRSRRSLGRSRWIDRPRFAVQITRGKPKRAVAAPNAADDML